MNQQPQRRAWTMNGFLGVLVILLAYVAGGLLVGFSRGSTWMLIVGLILFVVGAILFSGLVFPEKDRPIRVKFFGKDCGVIERGGLVMTVPMSQRRSMER